MLKTLRLENIGPAREMELDLGSRLNLVTGDNGLGKSFLLDVAWWALTRSWPAEVNPKSSTGLMARPARSGQSAIEISFLDKPKSYRIEFDRREMAWINRAGRPVNPGLVLYAQVDGGFSVYDPIRNYWRRPEDGGAPRRVPPFVFSPREIWEGLRQGDQFVCNGLLADWPIWQNSRPDSELGASFALLKKALLALSPSPSEPLVPGDLGNLEGDSRWYPSLRMPYGEEVLLPRASAGIRRIVALAYLLVWSWQEYARAAREREQEPTKEITFLIDEIEAHLHPRWQRAILRSLLEVMKGLAGEAPVQLLTATHSPLVLASAEPFFEPEKDAWFDIDLIPQEDSLPQVTLQKRDFQRQGDASSWLTSEAFDLLSARSIDAEQAIEAAREILRQQSPSLAEILEVDARLRKYLPGIDTFWVRWSAWVDEQKQKRRS